MSLDAQWAQRWIELSASAVAEHRDYLVDLDRAIGDGDHGENMDRGFRAAVEALSEAQPGSVAEVLKTVAKTLMSTVGGAAGPLYGTAFLRASKAAAGDDLDGGGVVAVIEGALSGIQARGKATTGEKTMVDAWTPALEAARRLAGDGCLDSDVRGRQTQFDIVGKRHNSAHLDALCGQKFVARHGRAAAEICDLYVHAEIVQRLFEF